MKRRAGLVQAVRLARSRATLGDLWDRLARVYGPRIAFTLDEPIAMHVLHARELSFDDLADVVGRFAGGLAALGVRSGDRVALCSENRIEYALALFAVARAGAVAVPLHHHLRPGEVEALARQSRAKFLVADPAQAVEGPWKTIVAGPGGTLDRASAEASRLDPAKTAPDEPVAILFTSGTTGRPKGATLTSRSLLAVARLAALVPDASEESGVSALPLAHVMGLSTILFSTLAGARQHLVTRFEPDRVLDAIQERRATFFVGVPAMYAAMAEAGPEDWDLSAVKLWASGADAMPPALVDRFRPLGSALRTPLGQRLLTAAFAEIYGMVELSGPAIVKLTPPTPFDGRITASVKRTVTRARGLLAKLPPLLKPAAAGGTGAQAAYGIAIPPYRVKIVGESGKALRAGQVGELLIKGPGVTAGYDGDAAATQNTTLDGWLRTGDLARRNRLGLIAFVTRKKDVIKHGGFSVFPAEVEAQLTSHPAIAEAVVLGAPHPTKGAVPVAVVVLRKGRRATVDQLLDWSRAEIAPFKAPRAIAILRAADIPRNANRKVLKEALTKKVLPDLQRRLSPPRGTRTSGTRSPASAGGSGGRRPAARTPRSAPAVPRRRRKRGARRGTRRG